MRWSNKKPKIIKEYLLLVATFIAGDWEYTLFEIKKTDFEDNWYWGIFTQEGDEWGDYAELVADKYCVIKPLGRQGKKGEST